MGLGLVGSMAKHWNLGGGKEGWGDMRKGRGQNMGRIEEDNDRDTKYEGFGKRK